jgi:hypothetical protein
MDIYIMDRYTMVIYLLKRKATDVSEEMNWKEEIHYVASKSKLIEKYHPDLKELIRRKYLNNFPCQPREIAFPYSSFGKKEEGLILISLMTIEKSHQ